MRQAVILLSFFLLVSAGCDSAELKEELEDISGKWTGTVRYNFLYRPDFPTRSVTETYSFILSDNNGSVTGSLRHTRDALDEGGRTIESYPKGPNPYTEINDVEGTYGKPFLSLTFKVACSPEHRPLTNRNIEFRVSGNTMTGEFFPSINASVAGVSDFPQSITLSLTKET